MDIDDWAARTDNGGLEDGVHRSVLVGGADIEPKDTAVDAGLLAADHGSVRGTISTRHPSDECRARGSTSTPAPIALDAVQARIVPHSTEASISGASPRPFLGAGGGTDAASVTFTNPLYPSGRAAGGVSGHAVASLAHIYEPL